MGSLDYHRLVEVFKFAYGIRSNMGDQNIEMDLVPIIENLTNPVYWQEIYNKIDDTQTFSDPEYYGGNFTTIENHGTSHISVYDKSGQATAITVTVNLFFGSKV